MIPLFHRTKCLSWNQEVRTHGHTTVQLYYVRSVYDYYRYTTLKQLIQNVIFSSYRQRQVNQWLWMHMQGINVINSSQNPDLQAFKFT